MIVLDTDHMSLLERRESQEGRRIESRLQKLDDAQVWTSIVSFEEQVRGWMTALARAKTVKAEVDRYGRLLEMLTLYCGFQLLPFAEDSAIEYQRLRKQHRRLASMDLKIASIAITNEATLISRNLQDFGQIPELKVEDWTKEETS